MINPGDILYARDGFAVMALPNGLLVGDRVYEIPEDKLRLIDFSVCNVDNLTPDRVEGMCCALFALAGVPPFELRQAKGVTEGFAKAMFVLNNGVINQLSPARKPFENNPIGVLWHWLQPNTRSCHLVHPYVEKLIVALMSGRPDYRTLPHPF